ncbi:MAG: tetratricopeptide repeat protein [Oscillospiraceae bacterium]|nr:tetratricopeptide repeat protein [Oscillospiraceae bacterium]
MTNNIETTNRTKDLIELGNTYFCGSEVEEDRGTAILLFGKAVEIALKSAKNGNKSDLETVICFLNEQLPDAKEKCESTPEEKPEISSADNQRDVFSYSAGELHDSFLVKEESNEPQPICVEDIVRDAKNCFFGRETPQDYVEARRLFEIAADKNSIEANKYLGYMYMHGLGGNPDYFNAEKCFNSVLANGETEYYEETSTCLAELYASCLDDMTKAVEIWEKLALKGNADAQYNYGLALFKGIGTEQEPERGIFWWQNAAANGHADAKHNLEVLFGNRK